MKTINKFLLEKLIINKDIKAGVQQTELVKLPVCDLVDYIAYLNKTWKELELPTTSYIIYKDKYRGNMPHFSTIDDFICSICYFNDDYEDFNPSKDILYASDNLKEILKWYFNYIGIKELPTKDNIDEWVSKYENAFLNKSNDNGQVLAKIYCGIDTYYNNPKYKNINYKTDLEKMLKNIFDIEK